MQAFVVVVPAADEELAADRLFGLGAVAVEVRASTDTGTVELWTDVGAGADAIERAASRLAPEWTWRIESVDEAVARTWRLHAMPTRVDEGLVIAPAWLDPAGTGAEVVVRIDPGSAFGLGDHPTTQLTLRSMRTHRRHPAGRVLDVGCGSGVLGIVAALAGAAEVVAIDISAAAVEATLSNAGLNGVAARVSASTAPLEAVEGTFDVVVANLLAPILVELADELAGAVAPGGVLIVSGILAEPARHEHVLAALAGFEVVDFVTMDGWAAATLSRAE